MKKTHQPGDPVVQQPCVYVCVFAVDPCGGLKSSIMLVMGF